MAITAGVVEMKILQESWNGKTYYLEAQMTVDPKEVSKRINEVLNDKQKTKELEESRKRALAAEEEAERLKKELAQEKNKNNTALQQTYRQQADALSAEEYFTKAENAYNNEWYELAIEYYQKALSIDPNYAAPYNRMGIAYAELENHTQAISCYQKALSIDPNFAAAYCNMGVAYNRLKNYTQAIKYYQKALSIDPNDEIVYLQMGVAYTNLGDFTQALSYLQKAVSIDPNFAKPYSIMGLIYLYQMRSKRKAIECYQKAARLGDEAAQETLREMGYKW
jgi:superkiller protein 3